MLPSDTTAASWLLEANLKCEGHPDVVGSDGYDWFQKTRKKHAFSYATRLPREFLFVGT